MSESLSSETSTLDQSRIGLQEDGQIGQVVRRGEDSGAPEKPRRASERQRQAVRDVPE